MLFFSLLCFVFCFVVVVVVVLLLFFFANDCFLTSRSPLIIRKDVWKISEHRRQQQLRLQA